MSEASSKGQKIPNVPNLRFPEFKNFYTRFLLGDLIIQRGRRIKPAESSLPAFSINNVIGFSSQQEQWGDNSYTSLEKAGYKYIEENDFAYNPARINVGSIGLYKLSTPCIVSSLYVCFKTKELLNPDYLFAFLKSAKFNKSILRTQEGGVRSYFFFDKLEHSFISIPSLSEQQKIADFLKLIEERINVQNKIIRKLESLKKMLRFLFFSGDKFEDSEHELGDYLLKIQCAKVTSPDKNKLMSVRLNEKGVCHNENVETLKMSGTIYYERRAGQFIYGKQNLHHGAIGIVPNELDGFLTSGDIPSLEIVGIDPYLILQIIGTQCSNWEKYASGTGSKRIHEDVLRRIKVNIPNGHYHIAISRVLKRIDAKIALEQKKAELLNKQKKFFLENMFI